MVALRAPFQKRILRMGDRTMNATNYQSNAQDMDYQVSARPARTASRPNAQRASNSRRRRSTPQQFNGIHRRRRKKIRW